MQCYRASAADNNVYTRNVIFSTDNDTENKVEKEIIAQGDCAAVVEFTNTNVDAKCVVVVNDFNVIRLVHKDHIGSLKEVEESFYKKLRGPTHCISTPSRMKRFRKN